MVEVWPFAARVDGELLVFGKRAGSPHEGTCSSVAHPVLATVPGWHCAQKVAFEVSLDDGARIVGTTGGEWGGQLVWLRGNSPPELLASGNMMAAVSIEHRMVIIARQTDVDLSDGQVLELIVADERPELRHLASIPGQPGFDPHSGHWNVWVRDETLWVGLDHGDAMVRVALDGTVDLFPCEVLLPGELGAD